VAVDYGASNPCVFGLYGKSGNVWYKVKEKYYEPAKSGSRTDKQLSDDMKTFLSWNGQPIRPKSIDVDPSAKHLIEQFRKDFPGIVVYPARNSVLDGIQTVAQALTQGLFKIFVSCKKTIEEALNYVWDAKAQERGEDKPVKKNDHSMDETRYWAMRVFYGLAKASAKPAGL
jgi:phage terminase large subunit